MYRVAALTLALTLGGPAAAQSYRTHPNAFGSTTYGSDGSTARTYDGPFGSTTYAKRPDGSRETCRSHWTAAGETTTCR